MITYYSKCICGAITLHTEDSSSYSCEQKNLKKFLPDIDLRRIKRLQESYCCDHCANHYGMDLCGCGSGEPFGKCNNGLEECSRPMQMFGKYTHIRGKDSWVA